MLLAHRPNFVNLFGELNRRRNEFDSIFDALLHSRGIPTIEGIQSPNFVPQLDAVEKNNVYVLSLEIPGIDEKDISISVENEVLTITGEKKEEMNEEKNDIHVRERYYGSFRREITLPPIADKDNIEASYKQGILTITVEKKEEEKPEKKQVYIKTIS